MRPRDSLVGGTLKNPFGDPKKETVSLQEAIEQTVASIPSFFVPHFMVNVLIGFFWFSPAPSDFSFSFLLSGVFRRLHRLFSPAVCFTF